VRQRADGYCIIGAPEGLAQSGWTEGRNLRVDYRWAGGDVSRIGTFAKELVEPSPDIIVIRRQRCHEFISINPITNENECAENRQRADSNAKQGPHGITGLVTRRHLTKIRPPSCIRRTTATGKSDAEFHCGERRDTLP
jgi:hypothetical protein